MEYYWNADTEVPLSESFDGGESFKLYETAEAFILEDFFGDPDEWFGQEPKRSDILIGDNRQRASLSGKLK